MATGQEITENLKNRGRLGIQSLINVICHINNINAEKEFDKIQQSFSIRIIKLEIERNILNLIKAIYKKHHTQ